MDNKKFEQLIDLIINENEEQARAMFHDIVVEKSREIYESLMDEEYRSEDQVGTLQNEIGAEEVAEEEEEFADIDVGDEEGGEEISLGADEFGDEGGEEELEDRVVDLEDKLDELMAEFEELMAGEQGEEHMGGDDMGGDDMGGDNDFGGDEEMMEGEDDDLEEGEELEEDTLEESVQLQKVSVTHGDNGVNTKSIMSKGPKVSGNGAKAVNFSGESTKGGTEGGLLKPTTTDVKGAGTFKNAPGKGNFSEKGESVAKPKQGDNGQNTKSITSESRKTTKRIVK